MTDCEHCLWGRHLGGRDYGCRNKERRKLWELDQTKYKMVNKGSYTCEYAVAEEAMTLQEAIEILEVAKGECEWVAPLDYQTAFSVAIEHLQNEIKDIPIICEVAMKMPSLNEYIAECRKSAYAGAKVKKNAQELAMWFIKKLPKFDKPISIHFHWVEGNEKRDQDNVTGMGHKVLLDALVESGKIKDDNKKHIIKTSDDFEYQKGVWKCIMEVTENERYKRSLLLRQGH